MTRLDHKGALQMQADYLSETIRCTERDMDRTADYVLREELEEKINGLKEARELEKVKEQQKDITKLRFKKTGERKLSGSISAIAISVGVIITAVVIGVRKAIYMRY